MAKKKKNRNCKTKPDASSKDVALKVSPNFMVKYRTDILLWCLIVLVFLIYSSGMSGPFIFDDMSNIEYNPHIRLTELSFDGLKKAAFDSPAASRPIANDSFALNYWLHGDSTFGYHLLNVLIHIAAGIFLYFFIRTTLNTPALRSKYEKQKWVALIAALIWLVHPLQTQSVTYLVQRMNSLAAMFYIMALFFYARGRLSPGFKKRCLWFGSGAAAGLLAFGSKQTAASLPFLIFLYE